MEKFEIPAAPQRIGEGVNLRSSALDIKRTQNNAKALERNRVLFNDILTALDVSYELDLEDPSTYATSLDALKTLEEKAQMLSLQLNYVNQLFEEKEERKAFECFAEIMPFFAEKSEEDLLGMGLECPDMAAVTILGMNLIASRFLQGTGLDAVSREEADAASDLKDRSVRLLEEASFRDSVVTSELDHHKDLSIIPARNVVQVMIDPFQKHIHGKDVALPMGVEEFIARRHELQERLEDLSERGSVISDGGKSNAKVCAARMMYLWEAVCALAPTEEIRSEASSMLTNICLEKFDLFKGNKYETYMLDPKNEVIKQALLKNETNVEVVGLTQRQKEAAKKIFANISTEKGASR